MAAPEYGAGAMTLTERCNQMAFLTLATLIDRCSSIVVLFDLRGPSAILRPVARIVIYSIKRMFQRWARWKIIDKILNILPSLTNCNSSLPIINIRVRTWIVATLHHAKPYRIERVLRKTVVGITLNHLFVVNAAAGLCSSRSQTASDNDTFAAASAATPPTGFFMFGVIRAFYDGQSPKSFSGDILESRHNGLLNRLLCLAGRWRATATFLRPSIAQC
jgi:hypothetical protein